MKRNLRRLQELIYLLITGVILCTLSACSSDDDEKYDPIEVNGHEAIDLGLSVKWAACNIGATTPTEYGSYYSYGETTTKNKYYWDTYKWCYGDNRDMLSKYCSDNECGDVDNLTTLTTSDDVATVKWGNKWRMPTKEEYKELLERCTLKWVQKNNVNGCLVTGPSGKSIFLPASGFRSLTDLRHLGKYGSYLTATIADDNNCAYTFAFDQEKEIDEWGIFSGLRCFGFPIRPVTE